MIILGLAAGWGRSIPSVSVKQPLSWGEKAAAQPTLTQECGWARQNRLSAPNHLTQGNANYPFKMKENSFKTQNKTQREEGDEERE